MNTTLVDQLIDLFEQAGTAHHQAFAEVAGADPEWPLWYANFLLAPLSKLLEAELTQSELVYLLVGLDREMRTLAPGADWRRFNARRLVERYAK